MNSKDSVSTWELTFGLWDLLDNISKDGIEFSDLKIVNMYTDEWQEWKTYEWHVSFQEVNSSKK